MSGMTGRLALAGLGLVVVASLFACVGSVGYGGGGYGPGYVEPAGYDYGGWGGAYFVGPGRGGERRGSIALARLSARAGVEIGTVDPEPLGWGWPQALKNLKIPG